MTACTYSNYNPDNYLTGDIHPKRFPFMPLVYIASAFSGDIEANTKAAREYARYAVDEGYIPIVPHLLYPQFLDEDTERDLGLFIGLVLVDRCRELWAFGEPTCGMAREISYAKRHGKTIRYFNTNFEEVYR
ncbi:DUF4406 domain-containing protein [Alloscardovia omnicolens]|uniref:DUF7768 domain-containing protein n=1 Tax=Alloscardovia omnicolens TaxID=419015 RepID=UPI003A724D94